MISIYIIPFQYADFSVYCMAKASMDMFTQCLALGEYLIKLVHPAIRINYEIYAFTWKVYATKFIILIDHTENM